MTASAESVEINIPSLPAKHVDFVQYVAAHPNTSMADLVLPFKKYDAELRKVFAQQPSHSAASQPNILPIFNGNEENLKIRARDINAESEKEKECYIMPLDDKDRRPDGAPAIVQSLRDFRTNFNVFSESSLVDLDWSNVVVAGSAAVTPLLAVPKEHGHSKRGLREYYHEKIAPASDIDLFLYGLTEEEAIKKIKQIEQSVRDAILVETTTIRTKNAITIASQHPVRHVQIVLRIYNSISEILTGFDVDSSCAAYDGNQVYASPRALAAFMTQTNTVDLTRRSPSYENRLSKYAHRGFEVYWPNLDRSRIDPTIFERSFGRTYGLARLLILEKLPKSQDRDAYMDKRRAERGRPPVNRWFMRKRLIRGNIKNDHEDEVAEWVDSNEVSDYHTFTVPYGPKFHARKIEKLLYTKDLLLNAEWNKPKDREVILHRHPAFFGTAEDVLHDCCGFCPKATTIEEEEAAEEECKVYINGDVSFMKDDPGRQTIGSFHPITADDWTDMAYVGNTARLCQAIVDHDLDYVRSWLDQEGNDPNTRDYTGRTPLHLAVSTSTIEIVQCLIDNGARLVARLADGKTALHIAAMRGSVEIVSALLRRSEANEEKEENKVDARRAARKAAKAATTEDAWMADGAERTGEPGGVEEESSDIDMMDDADANEDVYMDATTENSIVNIKSRGPAHDDKALAEDNEADDEPDVYDVNIIAWDTAVAPIHLAIVNGHVDVVKCLVENFGADLLLPIKIFHDHDKSAKAAILTLVLALQLPTDRAEEMVRTLIQLGASSAQADMNQTTAFQVCIANKPDQVDVLIDADETGVSRAINHLSVSGNQWRTEVTSPLMTAIKAKDSMTALKLLAIGAKPAIGFSDYMKAYKSKYDPPKDSKSNKQNFQTITEQPVISAVNYELPLVAKDLVEHHDVDPNTLERDGYQTLNNSHTWGYNKGRSLLDVVQEKLKTLKEWKYEQVYPNPPVQLKETSYYLSAFTNGTYAMWSALQQLESAKVRYKRDMESYEDDLASLTEQEPGVTEKLEAINKMAKEFELLETTLVKRGAKVFYDLYPDCKKPEYSNYHNTNYQPPKPQPFELEMTFFQGDLTDESRDRYTRLFEAAWAQDLQTVKELTLTHWTNTDGDIQPPLQIAVSDRHNLSPFSIAVLQGNLALATAVMEIARAQYVNPCEPKQQRYKIDGEHEGNEQREGSHVQLYSEIVDDTFTIEDIGKVSLQVKSRIRPVDMLQWKTPDVAIVKSMKTQRQANQDKGFSYFGPRKPHVVTKATDTGSVKMHDSLTSSEHNEDRKHIRDPLNIVEYAIYADDIDLLHYLINLGQDFTKLEASKDSSNPERSFSVPEETFRYSLEVGRPHLVAKLIKMTGAGIPLTKLAKKSAFKPQGSPKYYQGLSVYGKKRKDWATAGRKQMGFYPMESRRPPVLEAAHASSLEMVEWFLSDAPMRCYLDFADAHRDDKRLQRLCKAKGGFEASITNFLDSRSHIMIHCAVMAPPSVENKKLLRYLIKVIPSGIEAKSTDGFTPLQVAFECCHKDAAKLLIDAGAEQTCRDKTGRNLLHSLIGAHLNNKGGVKRLESMLDLIDKQVLANLFLDRSIGSKTPLAVFFDINRGEFQAEALKKLLQYSGVEPLSLIDGQGDTPLHSVIKSYSPSPRLARVILEHDLSLLFRENATGRTPFEMAEDAAIARVCKGVPPMPGHHDFAARRAKRFDFTNYDDQCLVYRDPKTFVSQYDKKGQAEDSHEEVWDIVKEFKARAEEDDGLTRRKPVSLNEANEVARRLAAMKSNNQYTHVVAEEQEQDDQDNLPKDEVQFWLDRAKAELNQDYTSLMSGRMRRRKNILVFGGY